MRRTPACFAAALAALAAAAPAQAGTVSVDAGTASFDSVGTERNDVTISRTADGTSFAFRDAASPIVAGAGCAADPGDAQAVLCPAEGVSYLAARLGNDNDTVRNATATPSDLRGGDGEDVLEGGSGPDVLDGQGGVDVVRGGAGNDVMFDVIDADGSDHPDEYSCGDGDDRVDADVRDIVSADCERVTRPAPPSGGGSPVPTPVPPGGDPGPAPGPCGFDMLGTLASDALAGDANRHRIFGLRGDDSVRGLPGDDCLFGGDGDDRVSGQSGADVVVGNAGDDRLLGGSGADRLRGGAGADRLFGNGGRNVIRGGGGRDRIAVANGRRDTVGCGPGRDVVRADGSDRLRGCERVIVKG